MERGAHLKAEQHARFEALYQAHYEQVLGYALRRADPEEAQDVVAETFLVAWRRLDVAPADPVPWLLGTARRALANQRRSARRREALSLRMAGHSREAAAIGDPGKQVTDETVMVAAFRRLSDPDQELLTLVAWDGLDAKQAAAVLGCSTATFGVRLYRARRWLARELEAEEDRSSARGPGVQRATEEIT